MINVNMSSYHSLYMFYLFQLLCAWPTKENCLSHLRENVIWHQMIVIIIVTIKHNLYLNVPLLFVVCLVLMLIYSYLISYALSM